MLPRLTTALAFVIMHSIVLPKHPNECPKSQYCMAFVHTFVMPCFCEENYFHYIGKSNVHTLSSKEIKIRFEDSGCDLQGNEQKFAENRL